MGLAKFVLRRLLFGLFTLFVVSVVVFAFTQLLPSDPAQSILGRQATPESLDALRQQLGLDRPAYEQYLDWLGGILTGDPGDSFVTRQPITGFIGDRIINSLFLLLCGAVASIPLALFIGSYAALRRDRAFDNASSTTTLVLAAVPEFVVGTLLTVLFATSVFHVLPAVTRVPVGQRPWAQLDGLVLPTLTLALAVTPHVARVMRASMIEVLESDYVEMARLKGLPERIVLWRHAFPNAVGPALQVIALNLAYLAAGAIIVERLFNYPGVGSALVSAIGRDIPVVQFLSMLIAAVYVVTNLMADTATILATPRLRTRLS